MTQKSHTIICLSSQSWDDGMWTNKQHIMSRLAKKHRVIHVDYGLRPLPVYAWRRIRHKPSDLLHPFRMLVDGVQYRQDSLFVADSYNPLLAGIFEHGNPIRDFATFDLKTFFLKRYLKKLRENTLRASKEADNPIVWVYHPGYADAVDRLPKKLLVYDCVDNYAAFPTYRAHQSWIEEREKRLCEKADLVFTTSQALYDLKKDFNPEHTHLVHNVGDYEHFARALEPDLPVADELKRLKGPIIGFVGAVSDYKLNIDWLIAAAKSHPAWNIVVVGPVGRADPTTDVGRLKAIPNVHLLGHRDYEVLPTYLKGFDVAVIPYRINEATRSVFPIKFFEFLATGTPTVISNLPALHEFYDAVRVAKTDAEFVRQCEAALKETDSLRSVEVSTSGAHQVEPEVLEHIAAREKRRALAEAHSWPARIEKIMSLIEARLA